MTRESLIRKLRGIYELAQRGATPGERDAALAQLERLLTMNSLTLDDLIEVKETRWFSYSSKYERKLLLQTVSAVLKSATFAEHSERVNGRLNGRKAGFELTHAQHIEVMRKYTAYKKALAEEMDRTYKAFIHKNHIYGTTSEKTIDDYTPEEIAEFEAMFRRAATMDGVSIHAELSAGK